MATRSIIGRQNQDGTITSIYCHWDGYPSAKMPILTGSYNRPEDLDALIGLGGLSSLDSTIEDCTAYHRDRGEEWKYNAPREHENFNEFMNSQGDAEYAYLGTQDENGTIVWTYYPVGNEIYVEDEDED